MESDRHHEPNSGIAKKLPELLTRIFEREVFLANPINQVTSNFKFNFFDRLLQGSLLWVRSVPLGMGIDLFLEGLMLLTGGLIFLMAGFEVLELLLRTINPLVNLLSFGRRTFWL